MKVTNRVLQDRCRELNAGVLSSFPFGVQVHPAGAEYRLSLLWRRSVSRQSFLATGSPREIFTALDAVAAFAEASKEAPF